MRMFAIMFGGFTDKMPKNRRLSRIMFVKRENDFLTPKSVDKSVSRVYNTFRRLRETTSTSGKILENDTEWLKRRRNNSQIPNELREAEG